MAKKPVLLRSGNIVFYPECTCPEDYCKLFLTTTWNDEYGFTREEIERSVRNVWYNVSAYDGDQLIGSGSILSDGIHHALIVNMIVHPIYQNKGIGKAILRLLIRKCKESGIRDIQLFAAENYYNFYKKFGFVARPDNAPGMQYKLP